MTPRERILDAIEHDLEGLREGVAVLFNEHTVEIAVDGRIWIGAPLTGRWLRPDEIARLIHALEAGEI